jgi:hypothetical protein
MPVFTKAVVGIARHSHRRRRARTCSGKPDPRCRRLPRPSILLMERKAAAAGDAPKKFLCRWQKGGCYYLSIFSKLIIG